MAGETEASLTQQLLDITRLMLNSGNCFTLRLTTSSIDFTASSNKKETPSDAQKKTKYKSPSQKQKNYTRKQNYLNQKFIVPISEDISDKPVLTSKGRYHICDICGKEYGSKGILKLHKKKDHSIKEKFVFSESMLDEWDPEVAGGNR